MSLALPSRPNLDHLRKQAKPRLHELRARTPDAQLADAQHAVARDYGFTSLLAVRGVDYRTIADDEKSGLPVTNGLQAASAPARPCTTLYPNASRGARRLPCSSI